MSKHLVRLFAILLVPCLMTDPVSAAAFVAPPAAFSLQNASPVFREEALSQPGTTARYLGTGLAFAGTLTVLFAIGVAIRIGPVHKALAQHSDLIVTIGAIVLTAAALVTGVVVLLKKSGRSDVNLRRRGLLDADQVPDDDQVLEADQQEKAQSTPNDDPGPGLVPLGGRPNEAQLLARNEARRKFAEQTGTEAVSADPVFEVLWALGMFDARMAVADALLARKKPMVAISRVAPWIGETTRPIAELADSKQVLEYITAFLASAFLAAKDEIIVTVESGIARKKPLANYFKIIVLSNFITKNRLSFKPPMEWSGKEPPKNRIIVGQPDEDGRIDIMPPRRMDEVAVGYISVLPKGGNRKRDEIAAEVRLYPDRSEDARPTPPPASVTPAKPKVAKPKEPVSLDLPEGHSAEQASFFKITLRITQLVSGIFVGLFVFLYSYVLYLNHWSLNAFYTKVVLPTTWWQWTMVGFFVGLALLSFAGPRIKVFSFFSEGIHTTPVVPPGTAAPEAVKAPRWRRAVNAVWSPLRRHPTWWLSGLALFLAVYWATLRPDSLTRFVPVPKAKQVDAREGLALAEEDMLRRSKFDPFPLYGTNAKGIALLEDNLEKLRDWDFAANPENVGKDVTEFEKADRKLRKDAREFLTRYHNTQLQFKALNDKGPKLFVEFLDPQSKYLPDFLTYFHAQIADPKTGNFEPLLLQADIQRFTGSALSKQVFDQLRKDTMISYGIWGEQMEVLLQRARLNPEPQVKSEPPPNTATILQQPVRNQKLPPGLAVTKDPFKLPKPTGPWWLLITPEPVSQPAPKPAPSEPTGSRFSLRSLWADWSLTWHQLLGFVFGLTGLAILGAAYRPRNQLVVIPISNRSA